MVNDELKTFGFAEKEDWKITLKIQENTNLKKMYSSIKARASIITK